MDIEIKAGVVANKLPRSKGDILLDCPDREANYLIQIGKAVVYITKENVLEDVLDPIKDAIIDKPSKKKS